MSQLPSLHPVQIGIIHALTFRATARFSELKTQHVSSDRFSFHLKRLLEAQLIERHGNQYRLTDIGKSIAGQLGSPGTDTKRNARVGVLIGCVRTNALTGEKEYLLQQRLKHPFFGCYGFMASKIQWGEKVEEAAKRGLKQEQGLTAKLTLVGVKHKMDVAHNELHEDKYFFVFRGDDARGKLIETFEGGRNFWATRKELLKLPNVYGGVSETADMLDSANLSFIENTFKVTNY